MKTQILIIAAAVAALTFGGCSSSRGAFSKGQKNPSTSISAKPKKGHADKATPSEFGSKPTQSQLCGGKWYVASVGSITINAEDETPYVHFEPQGRFYASDGCNVINGDYAVHSDGTMAFDHVLSTMKYCPDVEYSALIAAQFNDQSKPAIDCKRIGQDTYLYFRNASGNVMLTLRRQNMEFLDGNWMVTSIDGKKNSDEELTLFFDIAEQKIHGNTGCNFFNGDIYIDPARSNAIDISNIGLTRMACPDADRERRMIVALEEAYSAIEGRHENTVLLLDKKGKELLTLRRAPVTEDQN